VLPLLNEFKEKLLKEYKSPSNMTTAISACFKFAELFGSEEMDKVRPEDAERYKTHLLEEYVTHEGKNLSRATVVCRLLCLKRYFQFLVENKAIRRNPMIKFKMPTKGTKLPLYLPTEKEIEELLSRVNDNSISGMRDKAVIALMSIVPLKNKELKELTVDQIDLENKRVYPKKGTKETVIPMTDSAFQALETYLKTGRPEIVKWTKKPTTLLFVGRWGKPFSDGTLTVMFNKYNGYRNKNRIYPKLMRQATANHMRKNGMKLTNIRVALGVTLNTARTYTTLARNELKMKEEQWVEKIPLLKEFKEHLVKDELYPNIINKALKAVIFFAKYLKSENMKNVTLSDLEKCKNYIINEYISHVGKRLQEPAIIFRLNILKRYFNFLFESRYIQSNPTSDLKIPRAKPYIHWYFPTKEEIEEFASRPDQYSYTGIRDRALIRLWYQAPLKTREYKDINVQDVNLEKKVLFWKGAGHYSHLPLDAKTHKAMERYLKVSRPVFAKRSKVPTDKLFLNEWGDPFCESSIYEIFWKYRGNKPIKPYASRHVRAIDMLRRGCTVGQVKKTLGLKSTRICQAYEMIVAENPNHFYKSTRAEEKVKLLRREGVS